MFESDHGEGTGSQILTVGVEGLDGEGEGRQQAFQATGCRQSLRSSTTCSGMVQDNTRLFKLFADNPDFRRWLTDTVFRLAYEATR